MSIQSNLNQLIGIGAFLAGQSPMAEASKQKIAAEKESAYAKKYAESLEASIGNPLSEQMLDTLNDEPGGRASQISDAYKAYGQTLSRSGGTPEEIQQAWFKSQDWRSRALKAQRIYKSMFDYYDSKPKQTGGKE